MRMPDDLGADAAAPVGTDLLAAAFLERMRRTLATLCALPYRDLIRCCQNLSDGHR